MIFMSMVARHQDKGLSFIIGGATQGAIRRNVLDDMENILEREITLDKSSAFELFGNKVYVFDGANSNAWKKARGFTAAGAFLNESTALHDRFIKEVISRCSYKGAQVIMDTNPENPSHTVKTDYIDKSGQRLKNGRLNIKAFHFTLFDNDQLDEEYIESIVASTPTGMFTDRDIHGQWVSAEGVIYKDFNKDKNYISAEDFNKLNIVKYFAAVDWGYEHFGAIGVFAEDERGNVYLCEEHAKQHQEIDYWVDVAKGIKERYGNINFYCDSARPEHVQRFRREGLRAINAIKKVIAGIEEVAKMFKTGRLFIVEDKVKRFKDEIHQYAWNEKTGEPIKLWDDVLDMIRYGIYTHYQKAILKGKNR